MCETFILCLTLDSLEFCSYVHYMDVSSDLRE